MQKFIVSYSYATGSYDTHCVHHYGIEAEDKIDIQLMFLSAIENWKMKYDEWIKLNDRRPGAGDSFDEWLKLNSEFIERTGGIYEFVVNGMVMSPLDEMYKLDSNVLLEWIEIYTLDEWFEEIKPQRHWSFSNESK